MSNISNSDIVTELALTDYVLVVVNGCVKRITKADFIRGISLGGFSIIELWLLGISGVGLWTTGGGTPDTPPTMGNITLSLANRVQDTVLPSDEFLDKYYDADGDAFGKIVIAGGDVSGWTYNGTPLFIGQALTADNLINGNIEYDSKSQDASYLQEWFFETYDINNVIAQ